MDLKPTFLLAAIQAAKNGQHSQVNYSGDVRDSAVSGCSRVEPHLVPDQQPPSSPALDTENESSSRSAPATEADNLGNAVSMTSIDCKAVHHWSIH
ncbi:hypothetical protein CHARACLAT_025340 [Characodon lateralis]|uniref:Uncharacterized protein n=1 Tax=Characodon lateralis TaxID=208331 RepID=A0ABU7D0Q5_9TELE|nr:hypothetical protein [Characodon lateralis]